MNKFIIVKAGEKINRGDFVKLKRKRAYKTKLQCKMSDMKIIGISNQNVNSGDLVQVFVSGHVEISNIDSP